MIDPVIQKAIDDAVAIHGSRNKVSVAAGYSATALNTAIRDNSFGPRLLAFLGLRKIVKYERIEE